MQVLGFFPRELQYEILEYLNINSQKEVVDNLQEIRVRANRPVVLKIGRNTVPLGRRVVSIKEIMEIVEKICENSLYSYTSQICQGFITLRGGHRVGISGSVVMEQDRVTNLKYISNLNFRIARQKKGCSDKALKYVLNIEENSIYNTLIVSPPGYGKTTLLRDLVRNISDGIDGINFTGKTVGIVDERGEIAASYKGVPQNDVGIRTDVIENISKAQGMKLLIRSMAPEIIVCDEIGGIEETQMIEYAMCSGIKGIFTAHGGSYEEVSKNPEISRLLLGNGLERLIVLSSKEIGGIESVVDLTK